ncbi:hypothetical protein L7F22_058957 [Adiantum nelumboides]|nr:hypothetical protein [Adiantum nelumboides]
MARLFMSNIFKYHGMPQSIVSDRDPRMTSLFWRGLFENMGTTLKFSSSFHPQTDGQSEEANSTVLDLLKCYVSEHKGKWEQYLPLVEYAYNNTVHSSTGKAPFEIVEGGKKVPPILHTKDKIFEADKYVQDMDEMYKKVKVALEKTRAKQKKAADSHRREMVFSLGDWVLLRFEKARMDGNKEEGSSSEDRQPIPTAHEIDESSRQAEEALQVVTVVTMFKQLMENPRFMEFLKFSSMAHQVQGSFDMPRGTFGMAGYQNQQASTVPICPVVSGSKFFMPPVSVPMLQTPPMDQLMAYDKPKPYEEDDQSVQFDTFSGFDERNKVFSFLEQFDKAFAERILQKHSKSGKPPLF